MAAELIRRHVAVIAATTTPAALAVKAATTTVPIVFQTASDPVGLGLVATLNRPEGNVTGITQLNLAMAPKRLQLLHELAPTANVIVLLVNPANPTLAETSTEEMQTAARAFGLELHVLNASTVQDLDAAFAKMIQLRAGGLVIGTDPFFASQREQLAVLTVRHALPAVYEFRELVTAGGLMSYGGNIADSYRLAGVYTARILKGEKPADLPVQQATKVELYINLKNAKALGLDVPSTLVGRADEMIE
jgi:putative ABC transport system substrate-binding protein